MGENIHSYFTQKREMKDREVGALLYAIEEDLNFNYLDRSEFPAHQAYFAAEARGLVEEKDNEVILTKLGSDFLEENDFEEEKIKKILEIQDKEPLNRELDNKNTETKVDYESEESPEPFVSFGEWCNQLEVDKQEVISKMNESEPDEQNKITRHRPMTK